MAVTIITNKTIKLLRAEQKAKQEARNRRDKLVKQICAVIMASDTTWEEAESALDAARHLVRSRSKVNGINHQ